MLMHTHLLAILKHNLPKLALHHILCVHKGKYFANKSFTNESMQPVKFVRKYSPSEKLPLLCGITCGQVNFVYVHVNIIILCSMCLVQADQTPLQLAEDIQRQLVY